MSHRANYATLYMGVQLAPEGRALDLDWATNVGDLTEAYEFEVPTDDAEDAYVGLQAFDVGDYGHEIVVNDEALTGFDIPPNDGWQYWMDTLTGVELHAGTNTVRIRRDADSRDAFAVGTVAIHWKEPTD
ncbi:DUF7383 domain-containing protein [Salinigranum salinum]|uniref:DUF7383 domain-containing protein n=1 Tax=Salinigranum salinum TaxID=1364937 RepID=UPI0012607B53|nr:hypothetical protein [Salinigranum salinum]